MGCRISFTLVFVVLLCAVPVGDDLVGNLIRNLRVQNIPDVVIMETAHDHNAAPQVGLVDDAAHIGDIAVELIDKVELLVHARLHHVHATGHQRGVHPFDVLNLTGTGKVGLGVVPRHHGLLEGLLACILREVGVVTDELVEVGARRGDGCTEDEVAVGIAELRVKGVRTLLKPSAPFVMSDCSP